MAGDKQTWEMTNIQFGFVVYEKCYQTGELRTFFTTEANPILGDRYREGDKHWTNMGVAQSFQFDLKNSATGEIVNFHDLMGLMYCTGCMADCELDQLRKELEQQKTMMIVAFGFFPQALENPISEEKIKILDEYFNSRRDTSRSRIKVVPFNLIKDLSRCRGEFLHDIDLLSKEPPPVERKSFF